MLVRTPAPKTDESLLGYLLRTSETNGYSSPGYVLAHAGITGGRSLTAGFPIGKLATVLNREPAELQGIAYSTISDGSKREYKILDQSLGRSLTNRPLRLKTPQICPHCIQEDGYIQAFWDLTYTVACPKHQCRLLCTCTSCGKAIRWYRPGLLICECGTALSDIELESVSPPVLELMATLERKLKGGSLLDLPNATGLPMEDLNRMSFPALLWMISLIGKYYSLCQGRSSTHDAITDVEHTVVALGDYPNGYHDFLSQLGKKLRKNNNSTALRKQFASYYEAMFKNSVYTNDMKFLKREFVNFGVYIWGNATVDKKLLHSTGQQELDGKGFLSINQASDQIGVRPITLRRWIDKGLIKTKTIKVSGKPRHIIDIEKSDIGLRHTGRIMQERKAAAVVGLPVRVLQSLRKSRHYKIEHMPKHLLGFHEDDLNIFRNELLKRSKKVKSLDMVNHELLSLKYVMQKIKFLSSHGKAAFLVAYLDGRVKSVGRINDDVGSIAFAESDVTYHAKHSRRESHNGYVSRHETACFLNCCLEAIDGLVKLGYLVGKTESNKLLIDKSSIKSFSSEYIALVAIAHKHKTTVTRLLRLCTMANIQALRISRKEGSSMPFIKRDESTILLQHMELYPSRDQKRKAFISNEDKLRIYLQNLSDNGMDLPLNGNKPNIKLIATACGFDRNVFYSNNNVSTLLAEFVASSHSEAFVSSEERLLSYLKRLNDEGEHLPHWGKKPNLKQIASACGISRDDFYKNKKLSQMLKRYARLEKG